MSVTLTSPTGKAANISNGEWLAVTSMARAFGILDSAWNGNHDGETYTPDELRAMAKRAEQIGRASAYLDLLADEGGARLS